MKIDMEHSFKGSGLGVCIKNSDGMVLQQNKLCHDICGDCINEVCKVVCMELYAKDELQQWKDWGSRVYNNCFAHNAHYDITLICSDEYLISFLQPLEEKYKTALNYYLNLNLTKRETEIITFVIQGASNSKICKVLSVSKSTLKTHLNNIYKKINDSGMELKYFPKKRMSSIVPVK